MLLINFIYTYDNIKPIKMLKYINCIYEYMQGIFLFFFYSTYIA